MVSRCLVASQSAIPPPRPKASIQTPTDCLERALAANSPVERAKYARLGLSYRGGIDRTTQAMLLRQLYMAYYEAAKFRKALDVANQLLELRVMVDIAHQDAARACKSLGLIEDALGHLRLASRRGPASRRAFHLWTLGSTLFLAGRYREAAGALERAAQWGTSEKTLYQAHAILARLARGESVANHRVFFRRLAKSEMGEGYGRFVLGMMAYYTQHWDDAQTLLSSFVKRNETLRPATQHSLAGEVSLAQATLKQMSSS